MMAELGTLTADERLDFVIRNRSQIVENAAPFVAIEPELTGLHIGARELLHCR
ncbi:MAG: hypothetical protein IBJ13_02935 [Sphingopyxis sp.]|nr:hypothetical protein [Sphingopyxis sp.]